MRKFDTFHVEDPSPFKQKALSWSRKFSTAGFFDNFLGPYPHHGFQPILFAGQYDFCQPVQGEPPATTLYHFHKKHKDWLFGYLNYSLKDILFDKACSRLKPRFSFKPFQFIVPEHTILFGKENVLIGSKSIDPKIIFEEIIATGNQSNIPASINLPVCNMSRAAYIDKVNAVIQDITAGDVYELNLCMEFLSEQATLDPLTLFRLLCQESPMPFATYLKLGQNYLAGASPERFMALKDGKLIAQPIKGTMRRGADAGDDAALKTKLQHDEKERAENMMIVDLVRNDLAKSAVPGSVKVEEMFGIYTFKAVHQMISTVTAQLKDGYNFADALMNAFPMGSMTGAPKLSAMQRIDQYENNARSLYSGAAGYVTPSGDFDFNVVIRSFLYDQAKALLSFQVGSAITYDALPEYEYAECLLKAEKMISTLEKLQQQHSLEKSGFF